MTTEEKLDHFQSFCIENAKERGEKMLSDYTNALEQTYTEHQEDVKRRAALMLKTETEKIQRDINKNLALGQIEIKREISKKTEELKEKLFVEVKDMLENYTGTPEYHKLLEKQVADALAFAGDDEIIIYLDPVDADLVNRIALHHNAAIRVSEYSFGGGSRAVIASKNILIDNSFDTKLEEIKHNFKFNLGGN